MKDEEIKKEVELEWIIAEGPPLFKMKPPEVNVFEEDLSIYDSKKSYIFS